MSTVASDTWSTAVPTARSLLVSKISDLFGGVNDAEFRAKALEFLDDTCKDMNSHLYEFNKVFDQGIQLVDGQDFYQLGSPFYRESLAYLEKNSGGFRDPLTYLPWVHFQRLTLSGGDRGEGGYYSIYNVHDEGLVYLRPIPDDTTAADYILDIEYYRRIPLVSAVSEGESINVPQEVETALTYGAQKRMAIHIHGAGHEDVQALHQLEQQALARLKAVDKRHPDEQLRFRVVDFAARSRRSARGALYIRI